MASKDSGQAESKSRSGLDLPTCPVCGWRTLVLRQCDCCADWWLVCDLCEAAVGRLGAA